jgi:hypothetical protein
MESKAIQDYNENFLNLSPDQKQKLVEDLRTETIEKTTYSFFTIVRDLTLLGYFSSEIGTQARNITNPGRYDGNAEYKPENLGHIITISTNRKFRYQLNK